MSLFGILFNFSSTAVKATPFVQGDGKYATRIPQTTLTLHQNNSFPSRALLCLTYSQNINRDKKNHHPKTKQEQAYSSDTYYISIPGYISKT